MSHYDDLTPSEEESPPPFELIEHTSPVDPQRSLSLLGVVLEEDVVHHSELGLPLEPPEQQQEEEEEELPDYEPPSLPLYEAARLDSPVASYSLCQSSGKLQTLRPANELTMRRPWYNILFRSSPSLFSKKADMKMVRLTGTGRRDSAVAEEQQGDEVATMNFDKSGALPWMPRACVSQGSSGRRSRRDANTVHKMCAPNFNDWKIVLGDKTLYWCLSLRPWSLVLLDRAAEQVVARFTYSKLGTDAQKGGEVGRLEIYSGYGAEDDTIVELILASCQIPLQHWKSMGRHYRNDETPSRGSVATIRRVSSISSTPFVASSTNPRFF